MRAAGRVFWTPGLQHMLCAFRRASAGQTRRRSAVEGREFTLEAGQPKLVPVFLTLTGTKATIAVQKEKATSETILLCVEQFLVVIIARVRETGRP